MTATSQPPPAPNRPAAPGALAAGLSDFVRGFRMNRVWLALAREDIGDQHQRTRLGPIWLLVSYLLFAGSFVVIFGTGAPDYATYAAVGLLVWLYISEVVTASTGLFPREEAFIKGTTLPMSVYVMRLAMQATIRSGYAAVGCVIIIVLSSTPITAGWLYAILGIVLIIAATPAVIIVFAMAGTFFPDMQFIIGNVMRLGMFVTPVFWVDTATGGLRGIVHDWNPFTYFLEIVRVPIISGTFPGHPFLVCAIIAAALWVVAILLLGRFRQRVVFAI